MNQPLRQAVKFCEVIAERHPETGQYALLSGSWHYEKLWATPTSMNITMILDGLGHHPAADKYLEIFRQEQGTIVPPGEAYRQHAGYLATPRRFTSIDWLTDHGAILYAARTTPWSPTTAVHPALDGADRKGLRVHPGFPHQLRTRRCGRDPPGRRGHRTGVQNSRSGPTAGTTKDSSTAVRLLERIHHPRAEEFAARPRHTASVCPGDAPLPRNDATVDRQPGVSAVSSPPLPKGGDTNFPFYLDTGPLFLVYGGLMSADDDLMRSALHYFRTGPNTHTYDLDGAWHQPVCLHHEMSSCEPCYSWNVFHAWQTGDRENFLDGMYSLLTGSMSRRTSIGCEHRGGVSGTLFSVPLPIELVRLAVIDDQLEPGQLHLFALSRSRGSAPIGPRRSNASRRSSGR